MTTPAQNRDVYILRDDSAQYYIIPFTFDEFYQVSVFWGTGKHTQNMYKWNELQQDIDYTIIKDMVGGSVKILNPSSLVDENGDAFSVLNIKSSYFFQNVTPHQVNYSQHNNENITDDQEIQIQQMSSHLDYIDDILENSMVKILDPSDKDRVLKIYDADTNTLQGATITCVTGAPTTIQDNALVTGYLQVTGNLTVSGASSLQSVTATTITTSSNVSVGGTLYVEAATTLNSTLSVAGSTTLNGTLTVAGATVLNATLSVTGATALNGTLTVAGSATFNSPVDFKSNVAIDGNTVAHAVICTTLTATGTVNVGGALFCSSTSEFVGAATFRSTVDVYGTLWARTSFNVAGNSILYGNVEIKGTTTAQAINATSVTAPQITSTDNLTFGKTFIMDGQTFRMGQISETIQNFYLFKVAAQSDGSWVIYMAPDANDGTGEPPENAPPFNNFAIGDGMGDVKASRMDQDDNLEHIITPYDFIANTIKAERDLAVARNFILDGGIYNTLSLEGTYDNGKYLRVEENETGNRQLVWSTVEGGGGGAANVAPNVIAMGGPEGELVNSMLVQNSVAGYINTGYGLSSRDIKLQSNIAEGSTTIGSMNTQTMDWQVFFDFRGLEQLNQGEIAPLYAKYYGNNTISIFAGIELSPDLFVAEPAIDHALAVWNGHTNAFENKYINNVTPPSLQDYVMSNAIFTDELLITSHANLMYPFGLSSNMIYLDVDKATEFYGDYATSCNITIIGDMVDGHEIVIALRRVNSGGIINWPSEWRWSMKFAPISSNFPIMQYVIILLQRNGSVYYAKRINAQALQQPDTSKVIVLGEHRDNAPLNFFDTQGYKLEVVNQGTIYGNVLNGLVLNTLCIVKSSYSDTRVVVIANNVLDIVLGSETEFVVKVQHDEDIAAVNITFDADEIPTNAVIRFSIVMMKGLSIQTAIPMPDGIKAPAVIETNELLLGDYNNTIFQFVAIPGNGLYYIGGIAQ